MIKKLVIGASAWTAIASGLLIGKSTSTNDIVFGNYSDYISPEVAKELRRDYNLKIDLFDYDHLVKERFDKGIYDMAIVSTSVLSELKSTGSAMKLDWAKLLGKSDSSSNWASLSKEVTELFTPIVQDMSKDLLEYGIPYFVQKLGFYYRGNEISGLKEEVTFKTLVEKISEEERFKSTDGKAKLGLIDDPRTVLSFARKVKGIEDVNPKDSDYSTSASVLEDYKSLITSGLSSSKLGKNFLFMTPDSGPLVDALSNGDIEGAFMYNGDGLFATEGGNAEKEIEDSKFHYVNLSENIFFLDFLAFSKKMPEHKKENAYNLARELLFITEKNKSKPFKEKNQEEEACGKEEPEYEETAIRNFNDVMYTPVLKSIYDKLGTCYFKEEEEEAAKEDKEESDDEAAVEEEEIETVKGKKKHEIIKVEKSTKHPIEKEFEKQLSPEQKSNMLIAYSDFKLQI